jgi:hypothetical protein
MRQRVRGDMRGIRLDALVFDARVREQQRELDICQLAKQGDVFRLHLVASNREYVIAEATGIKIAEHGQGAWPHAGQERVGGPVEDLQWRVMRPEVAVRHELLDGHVIEHEGAGYKLVP